MDITHDNHHFPFIAVVIKALSFVLGVVAFLPAFDLIVRVASLTGMFAGLWLTYIIHEEKVQAKLSAYKRILTNIYWSIRNKL